MNQFGTYIGFIFGPITGSLLQLAFDGGILFSTTFLFIGLFVNIIL